jgi:hypothetical protein
MSSVDSLQAEQAAIGELLFTLASGFRELDASKFESIYVEDADWTNAFGTVLHGREHIVSRRRWRAARAAQPLAESVGQARRPLVDPRRHVHGRA